MAVRATTNLRSPFHGKPDTPVNIGLDSCSDITVVGKSMAYDCRDIEESIRAGGGNSKFKEEGKVDVLLDNGNYATILGMRS